MLHRNAFPSRPPQLTVAIGDFTKRLLRERRPVNFDAIVVGLGAMGSATLYQLALRGVAALGIDMHHPPHDLGSSHGETRVTRQGVGEGSAYVPLVLRSHEIWRELESLTGQQLLLECGFLAIDGSPAGTPFHGQAGFFERTLSSARNFGIDHELLSTDQARTRFPQFLLTGNERIYFEPGGGLVYPERCIAAQLEQAAVHGATIHSGERVVSIEARNGIVELVTNVRTYQAPQVIVCAGGWSPALTRSALAPMRLLRQVLHWFEPVDSELYVAGEFPTFIWLHGDNPECSFYGFPIAPGATGGVKVATENYSVALPEPEAMGRSVEASEVARMHAEHVAGRLAGVSAKSVKSVACFYTFAPDGGFVIDSAPDLPGVTIVSACSGHGFKHSAGIGEHVAQLVVEGGDRIAEFRLDRPGFVASS